METNRKRIKYFLYARKSEENEDRQVQSIDDQISALKQLAARGGHSIKEILTESHSAKTPGERPVFNSMLARIERGEANGILCWQINRLSRNPVDSARVQWLLQQGVIQSIQTIDGERRPEDNVLLLSVESGVSNQFIIDLRKNVKRGLSGKAERGWLPCLAPAGYLNEPRERTIVRDPDRFGLIRKMWDLLLTGTHTPKRILHIANGVWGYRTRKTKRAGNKELSLGGLYKIFGNPFYCGLLSYAGRSYAGKHAPMVTVAEFDAAQGILGRNGRPRPKKYEHTYSGILRCQCGCAITAETKSKLVKSEGAVRSYTYYRCTKRKKDCVCAERGAISENELESEIRRILGAYEITPEFLMYAKNVIAKRVEEGVKENELLRETRGRALADTKNEISSLTAMRYRGLIEDEEFMREKEMLKMKEAQLELTLREDEDKSEIDNATMKAFRFATHCQLGFISGEPQVKREILATVGSNQRLSGKKLSIDRAPWLSRIKEEHDVVARDFGRLEPWLGPMNSTQKEAFASLDSRMWATVQDVRTILRQAGHIHIPDIRIDPDARGGRPVSKSPSLPAEEESGGL